MITNVITIICGLAMIIFFCMIFLGWDFGIKNKVEKKWLDDEMLNRHNLQDSNIHFKLLGIEKQDSLYYTKDKKLYIINIFNKTIEAIKFEDVLEIDTEIISSEKNVRQLISVTVTTNKVTTIHEMNFKVRTYEKDYVIKYVPNRDIAVNLREKQDYQRKEEMKRAKLILDRDIANLKLN